jgi:rhodanese-related sulfurtransferase
MSPLHTQVSFKIEDALKKMLKGSVPVISTGDLADLIKCESDWLILDSRELVEFKTSHLPNAKWVGDHDFSICRLSGTPKDTKVVVYCSIGVRSEKIAEKLKASGFSNVWNLYGGIFAWSNEHKSLVVQSQKPTLAVHGYDHNWAKLLDYHVHCIHTK